MQGGSLQVDIDVGLWPDDNVNNAPERDTVEVPALRSPTERSLGEATCRRSRWSEHGPDRTSLCTTVTAEPCGSGCEGCSRHHELTCSGLGTRGLCFRVRTFDTEPIRGGHVIDECSAYPRVRGGRLRLDVHKETIAVALPGCEEPLYQGEIKNQHKSLLRLIRALSPNGEVVSF